MYVYLITNLINNKYYVGQTSKSIQDRFKSHCHAKNTVIAKAIRSYGKENFKIEILETNQSQEELNNLEIFYIKKYNSKLPNGYNILDGGLKFVHNELTCQKISESKKRLKPTEKQLENLKLGRVGHPCSNETKEKLRKYNLGRKATQKQKEALMLPIREKIVEATNLKTQEILIFSSVKEACQVLNINRTGMNNVIRGKWKHYKNYIFKVYRKKSIKLLEKI